MFIARQHIAPDIGQLGQLAQADATLLARVTQSAKLHGGFSNLSVEVAGGICPQQASLTATEMKAARPGTIRFNQTMVCW
jgi:hypothetical protein